MVYKALNVGLMCDGKLHDPLYLDLGRLFLFKSAITSLMYELDIYIKPSIFSTQLFSTFIKHTFHLYLSICDVDCQINVAKGSRSDFPNELVFPTDYELGFRATAAGHVLKSEKYSETV